MRDIIIRFLIGKVLLAARAGVLAGSLLAVGFAGPMSGSVMAQDGAGQPVSKNLTKTGALVLSFGTATPGGGFPVFGNAFAEVMNAADPGIVIAPRNTKGSAENIPLLESGGLDIALVAGEPAYEAFAGIGRPPTNLKVLTAIYSSPGMFVVRADSPYRRISDLKGKRVAFGASGSGLVLLSRYILDGLGFEQDRDFQAVYLDRAGDGPNMVLDGRVAALWGAGLGWPGFAAVAESPGGARFIAPDEGEIARIRSRHPFLRPMTVAAGSYPGQTEAIASLGSWSFILVRPDLDEEVVYRLARTIHQSETRLGARLPQARETTAANTIAAMPETKRLHPGVVRYFREIGLVK